MVLVCARGKYLRRLQTLHFGNDKHNVRYDQRNKIRALTYLGADSMTKKWETYEEVATYLLDKFADDFGFTRFEGKQKITGKLLTWEIDAKGVCENNDIFMIVECRRYTTSRINQESLAAIAFRIEDIGSEGGIIISPLGLQKGAKQIAKAKNIVSVTLNESCTPTEFRLFFLEKLRAGKHLHSNLSSEGTLSANVIKKDGTETDLGELNTR